MMMSEDAMVAWRAFLEMQARLMPVMEAQLVRDGGLTNPQYGILLALQGEPQGLTMTEIARTMVVSASGLTYQVNRLVEDERVARAVDPDDERRRVVRITRTGIEALDDVGEGHLAIVNKFFAEPIGKKRMGVVAHALVSANDTLKGDVG